MKDKGYAQPLYSLDLLIGPASPPEDDHYAVPVKQGRLVVRPGLRQQGARIATLACVHAVRAALSHFPYAPEVFEGYGLDAAWIDHMDHWCKQAHEREADWLRIDVHALAQRPSRQNLPLQAQRLWTQLHLASDIAGLGSSLVAGRIPQGRVALLETLRTVVGRLEDPDVRERLAPCGFGPSAHRALEDLVQRMRAALDEDTEMARLQRVTQGALAVIRGALIGDLTLFCRAGRLAFPRDSRRELRLHRLLQGAPEKPLR